MIPKKVNHTAEKQYNSFQLSLSRVEGLSSYHYWESLGESSPMTCDPCLGVLINRKAKSGNRSQKIFKGHTGFICASVTTSSPNRQAFLSKQLSWLAIRLWRLPWLPPALWSEKQIQFSPKPIVKANNLSIKVHFLTHSSKTGFYVLQITFAMCLFLFLFPNWMV